MKSLDQSYYSLQNQSLHTSQKFRNQDSFQVLSMKASPAIEECYSSKPKKKGQQHHQRHHKENMHPKQLLVPPIETITEEGRVIKSKRGKSIRFKDERQVSNFLNQEANRMSRDQEQITLNKKHRVKKNKLINSERSEKEERDFENKELMNSPGSITQEDYLISEYLKLKKQLKTLQKTAEKLEKEHSQGRSIQKQQSKNYHKNENQFEISSAYQNSQQNYEIRKQQSKRKSSKSGHRKKDQRRSGTKRDSKDGPEIVEVLINLNSGVVGNSNQIDESSLINNQTLLFQNQPSRRNHNNRILNSLSKSYDGREKILQKTRVVNVNMNPVIPLIQLNGAPSPPTQIIPQQPMILDTFAISQQQQHQHAPSSHALWVQPKFEQNLLGSYTLTNSPKVMNNYSSNSIMNNSGYIFAPQAQQNFLSVPQNPLLNSQHLVPKLQMSNVQSVDNLSISSYYSSSRQNPLQNSQHISQQPSMHFRVESQPPFQQMNISNYQEILNTTQNMNRISSQQNQSKEVEYISSQKNQQAQQPHEQTNQQNRLRMRSFTKRGVKTEVPSIQGSSQKPALMIQTNKLKKLEENSIGIMTSSISDVEKRESIKQETPKEKKDRKRNASKHQRQYSQIIAENIIESPTERNYRDNKNNNIWGIRELDMKQKLEHNFDGSEEEDNSNKLAQIFNLNQISINCDQLKIEIAKQQQSFYDSQQNSSRENLFSINNVDIDKQYLQLQSVDTADKTFQNRNGGVAIGTSSNKNKQQAIQIFENEGFSDLNNSSQIQIEEEEEKENKNQMISQMPSQEKYEIQEFNRELNDNGQQNELDSLNDEDNIEVANERDSIRMKLEFNQIIENDEEEDQIDRRKQNMKRSSICRSKSEIHFQQVKVVNSQLSETLKPNITHSIQENNPINFNFKKKSMLPACIRIDLSSTNNSNFNTTAQTCQKFEKESQNFTYIQHFKEQHQQRQQQQEQLHQQPQIKDRSRCSQSNQDGNTFAPCFTISTINSNNQISEHKDSIDAKSSDNLKIRHDSLSSKNQLLKQRQIELTSLNFSQAPKIKRKQSQAKIVIHQRKTQELKLKSKLEEKILSDNEEVSMLGDHQDCMNQEINSNEKSKGNINKESIQRNDSNLEIKSKQKGKQQKSQINFEKQKLQTQKVSLKTPLPNHSQMGILPLSSTSSKVSATTNTNTPSVPIYNSDISKGKYTTKMVEKQISLKGSNSISYQSVFDHYSKGGKNSAHTNNNTMCQSSQQTQKKQFNETQKYKDLGGSISYLQLSKCKPFEPKMKESKSGKNSETKPYQLGKIIKNQ